jgi:hypothetical protein
MMKCVNLLSDEVLSDVLGTPALLISARLINHGTVFFSHNKTAPGGLSATETIQRTGLEVGFLSYLEIVGVCVLKPLEAKASLEHYIHYMRAYTSNTSKAIYGFGKTPL